MCGIGGVFIKRGGQPHQVALEKMCTALNNRGPDVHGVYTDKSIGLIHTRLSIIDTNNGHQPMIDTKGRTVVFDGKIYNYLEIRKSLENSYNFKTHSDTETILALYDVYGLDFVDHLRGMYAIALYDPAHNRLIITRDPFGIKPLYITNMPSHVAFASEPKALIQSGYASDTLDMQALRSVVTQNYIGGLDTPYPAIQHLQAGEKVVYEHGIRISSSLRPAISHNPPRIEDEATALLHLEKTLLESIDLHCRSDVGYGVFLSGGVISSTILQTLSMLGEQGKEIKTYTSFCDPEKSIDERDIARNVATSNNANYHEVQFNKNDFVLLLPQIAAYMDSPVANPDILPMWKLAGVAAAEQKVILTGDGGNILFGGEPHYRTNWWKNWRKPKSSTPHWSQLQSAQAEDINDYLPNNLLAQLDNCLMAHGVEGRTPFLDMALSEFAFALPDELKLQGKTGAYLLKKWLDSKLPAAKPFRKKPDLPIPVGEWISADARNLSDIMVHHPLLTELLSKSDLELLPKLLPTPDGAKQCWPLIYLALWHTGKQKKSYAENINETLAS